MQHMKSVFNINDNQRLLELIKIALSNGDLESSSGYIAWKKHITRYVSTNVIHRKKNILDFEKEFGAEFFEILFAIHLIVYIMGRKMIADTDISQELKDYAREDLFESVFQALSDETKETLRDGVGVELANGIKNIKTSNSYDLFEEIYRAIVPKEIRTPLGEYFTPLALAERMTEEYGDKHDGIWMDNSSGFGAFFFAFLNKFGVEHADDFICTDANPLSVFITKTIFICEYGKSFENIKPAHLHLHWGDTLLNERYEFRDGVIKVVGDFSEYHNAIQVVIGNPPWVAWKSMTKEYQSLIGVDWRSYGLLEEKITRSKTGVCNDDISSYFVYYSIDKFLKRGGILKFVINLTLFKSNLVGTKFRKFHIEKNDTSFKIMKISDLSNYKIFKGITNTYCVFEAKKGERTTYPINYFVVTSKKGGDVNISKTTARPVHNKDGGALITVNGNERYFDAIEGKCDYKARAGVCTWLNSVYWVKKINEDDSIAKIVNLGKSGKRKVVEIEASVEKELVFRLLRARNLADFKPIIENSIIVPQNHKCMAKPISEEIMSKSYGNALKFFANFKEDLIERSGYKLFLKGQPYYGLYNIGEYTVAPIKLGWQFISKKFRVYIINNASDIIPDLNVMFIPLEDMDEAFYLHALLNSKYAREKIESSSNWTFPSGSIKKVYLEQYNGNDELHRGISVLQRKHIGEGTDIDAKMDFLIQEYWFNGRKRGAQKAGERQLSLL